MTGFKSLVAKELGSVRTVRPCPSMRVGGKSSTYLKDIPYWATASYPDFQTSVTSQALVAWSLHERNAEI